MFERIRRSLVIEKAHELWRSEGVNTRSVFKRLDFTSSAGYREGLRKLQSDGLELHDVAVVMIMAIWPCLSVAEQGNVLSTVSMWHADRLIMPHLFSTY